MIDALTFHHLSNYVTTDRELAYAATVTDRVLAACESEPEETNVSTIESTIESKSTITGPERTLSITGDFASSADVWVAVNDTAPGKSTAGIRVDRADFLRAVEGLGVIVVDRADLPEVVSDNCTGSWPLETRPPSPYDDAFNSIAATGPNSPNGKPEWHRGRALAHLALAEHLDAHPPVDREAVSHLVQTFAEVGARIEGATFEDLVARGVRVEVQP